MRRTRIISAVGHRRITCQLYAVGNQKQKQNRRSHRISLTSLCQDGRKHFKYNKVHGIEDSDAEGLVHCERGERLLRFRESLAYFGPMGDPSQEIVPRVQGWSFETQAHHHKGERPDRVPSKGGARRVREQSLRTQQKKVQISFYLTTPSISYSDDFIFFIHHDFTFRA